MRQLHRPGLLPRKWASGRATAPLPTKSEEARRAGYATLPEGTLVAILEAVWTEG